MSPRFAKIFGWQLVTEFEFDVFVAGLAGAIYRMNNANAVMDPPETVEVWSVPICHGLTKDVAMREERCLYRPSYFGDRNLPDDYEPAKDVRHWIWRETE